MEEFISKSASADLQVVKSQSDFINNPLVIDYVTKEFDYRYKKELCPEWISFDLFRTQIMKSMFLSLYDQCCLSMCYSSVIWRDYYMFEKRIEINNFMYDHQKIYKKIPDEINLLIINFDKYNYAKSKKSNELYNKIVEKYENDVKIVLDLYLCDDIICIIIGLLGCCQVQLTTRRMRSMFT